MNWIEHYKESIYFSGMLLTLFFAGVVGVWSYRMYESQHDNNIYGIMDVVISPFFLGIVHFLLVFFLGLLIVTTISLTHTRRMKAFNLEVEFEAREHKEIKVGQVHYLSEILGSHDILIGQFIEQVNISYMEVLEVLCDHYREYFTESFNRDLSYKIFSLKEIRFSHSERQLLKYMNRHDQDVSFQNRLVGDRTLLIGITKKMVTNDKELVLIFRSDKDYEFDEYDAEAIKMLMKYGDIIVQHLYFIRE
ncbi:hypothetical protein [Lentibacillus halophilus]